MLLIYSKINKQASVVEDGRISDSLRLHNLGTEGDSKSLKFEQLYGQWKKNFIGKDLFCEILDFMKS